MGTSGVPASAQIDGVALEIGEAAIGERPLMRRAQHDTRRQPGLERLLPAWRAEAPAIARLQPREAVIRHRRREIVAARLGVVEEADGGDDAHRMAAAIGRAGIAAAVAEEPGDRPQRAILEPL